MSHTVTIQPSGHTFSVDQGETILDAALRQGFALNYSCRGGSCGACRGKLLDGQVSYKDRPLCLSDEDEKDGVAVFCQAELSGDAVIEAREIGFVKELRIQKYPCRVASHKQLAHDVMQIFLKIPPTSRMAFFAGQYIDIILKDGRRRSFSIANAPHDDEFIELHVRHVPGGVFTGYVFDRIQEKDLLRFEGPLGSFVMREESERPLIFVAGGTGFAPIKGLVEHLIAEGSTRPIHLYWGVRAKRDLYMDELAQSWADQHDHISYTPVLSEAIEEDSWQGATGFVHECVLAEHADLAPFDIYVSGPPALVRTAESDFAKHGMDVDHFYFDSFEFSAE